MNLLKENALIKMLCLFMIFSLPLTCLANRLSNFEVPDENTSEEAIQLFEQGREAFEMGRINDASMYFDQAVQKDARLSVAWLYKALSAETETDRKASINKAELYRNSATQDVRILIDMEQTYTDNNSEKRFQLAKDLAELHPESARALLALAAEYQAKGEISKYRDLATEAIFAEPGSPLGYRALGASYLLNEPIDFSLAEKYMKKFVELRPHEASAHIALGDVYRAKLQLENAKAAYSKAIVIDPENAASFSKRGYIHTYRGMFDEARADFKKADELFNHAQDYGKPNYSVFSYLFAGNNGKNAANDTELIVEELHNSRLPLEGESDNCYFCCTVISMAHGLFTSPDKSLNSCNCLRHELDIESRVPDRNTIEADIAFMKGFRAVQREDFEEAKRIIEEYAHTVSPELNSRKNEAHNFLAGLIYAGEGKYEKALANFKRSDTENVFVKYNMGLVYDKLGMYEKANAVFTDVANFKFANAEKAQLTKTAEMWLQSYENSSLAVK